jgi:hypothetical protein
VTNIEKYDDLLRVQLAASLCDELKHAGISFGILHGAEGYPQTVGRDFDIIIGAGDVEAAISIVRRRATEEGWYSVHAPIPWAGAPIILWKSVQDDLHTFEFHFIPQLVWGGVVLAKHDPGDIRPHGEHGLPVAVKGGFAKRVLTQVLAGCWDRTNERIHKLQIHDEEKDAAIQCVNFLFGESLGKQLLSALSPPDLVSLRGIAPRLRFAAMARAISPFSGVELAPSWYLGKISRLTGRISWKLPNLVILSASSEASTGVMEETLNYLTFTNSMVLDGKMPDSIFSKAMERLTIRRHRGLFRFVAMAGCIQEKSQLAKRLPPPDGTGGNLFIVLDEELSLRSAEMHLGRSRSKIDIPMHPAELVPAIASVFFHGVRATEVGIDHFKDT